MRAMGLALLITLVAFAGCLDGGDGDDSTPTDTATGSATPTETATATETQTDTGTSDPEPEENTPPTASLSASIEQGEVPVNVTFTVDGADADGDDLNWTFDADGDGIFEAEGNGTGLPATYNHSYASNGTYNATLTVSDGKDSATQTVTINATAAAEEQGPAFEFSGSYAAGGPAQGCVITIFTLGDDEGATHVSADIPAAIIGLPYQADWTFTAPAASVHVAWAKDGGIFQDDPETPEPGSSSVSGTVPDADTGIFSSCGGVEAQVTFTAG